MTTPESQPNARNEPVRSSVDYTELMNAAHSESNARARQEQLHELPVSASHQAELLLVERGLKPATFDVVREGSERQRALLAYAQAVTPFMM